MIPWLVNGDETTRPFLASATIVLRAKSLDEGVLRLVAKHGFSISATDNGLVNREIVAEAITDAASKMSVSKKSPGIVILDGHSTHLSRELIRAAAEAFLWPIILPSNLSTMLQVGDLGPNGRIEITYKQRYTMLKPLIYFTISCWTKTESSRVSTASSE